MLLQWVCLKLLYVAGRSGGRAGPPVPCVSVRVRRVRVRVGVRGGGVGRGWRGRRSAGGAGGRILRRT